MAWLPERLVHAAAHAFPFGAEMLDTSAALRGDRVVDPLAAVHALALRLEGAALFEAVQDWVDHALAEADGFGRHEPDGFDDLIAVHFPIREHSQHEQLGHAGHERWVRLRHNSPCG